MIGKGRRRLTKEEERCFAEMWAEGATHEHISAVLGLGGTSSTASVRRRLGLPLRKQCWSLPEKPVAVPEAAPEEEICAPAMPPHPFWSPVRDLAVMGTAGRYPAITALAAEMGRPVASVMQRWHQLRAA